MCGRVRFEAWVLLLLLLQGAAECRDKVLQREVYGRVRFGPLL